MGADVHTIAAAGCSDGKACLLRFPWGPAWDQGCHAWWALGDGIAMKRTCMPPQTCHGIGPYKPIPSSLSLHILRRSSEFRYILCIQRISLHILHPANFATHSASSEFRYTFCIQRISLHLLRQMCFPLPVLLKPRVISGSSHSDQSVRIEATIATQHSIQGQNR